MHNLQFPKYRPTKTRASSDFPLTKVAFGSSMSGLSFRHDSVDGYRFGFNNQEKDDEINSYAFEYREHDTRIGRFWSVDPIANKFANQSPYVFGENRVIDGIEFEGLEYVDADEVANPQTGETFNDRYSGPQYKTVQRDGHTYINIGMDLFRNGDGTLSFTNGKNKTTVSQWLNDPVSTVVGEDKFVPYSGNCYDAAAGTCAMAGAPTPKGTYQPENQMYADPNSGITVNDWTKANGLYAIDKSLYKYSKPILVGVNFRSGHPGNADQTTDHYIAIVGKGTDANGTYYEFFDNATGGARYTSGTKIGKYTGADVKLNRLYIQPDGTLRGISTWGNTNFTVTEVRQAKGNGRPAVRVGQ